jgi:hypothetical protein
MFEAQRFANVLLNIVIQLDAGRALQDDASPVDVDLHLVSYSEKDV